MGWRSTSRRHLVGEQTPLSCVGGDLWIAPKKWSTATADAVADYRRQTLSQPGATEKIKRLIELQQQYEGLLTDGVVDQEKLSKLDGLELVQLSNALAPRERTELYRMALRDGIGAHNLADDDGKAIGGGDFLDKKTIEEILQQDVLAAEMFQVIEAYNRPLARRSSASSATSSSGSSGETDSLKEKNSPTGPAPQP